MVIKDLKNIEKSKETTTFSNNRLLFFYPTSLGIMLATGYLCDWPILLKHSSQFSSVQSLSRVQLFVTPWIAAHQASMPSPTPRVHSNSRPSSQSCHPAISSSVVPFSSCLQPLPASQSFPMSQLFAWGGQYWSFSFSIIPSKEIPGLISFRIDWLDLLAVQGTLKSLLQHHSSRASILRHSAFFTVQLSHPYMTTGKTITLTRWTFVGKVMSLLLNKLLGRS